MLSREDMLQELELLPVWQLRQVEPIPAGAVKPVVSQVENAATESTTTAEPVISTITPLFRLLVSDDTQWAFIVSASQSEEADTLLQNMLKAVSVKVGQDLAEANAELLSQQAPKVVVVMGEAEAQQLLDNQQTLVQLRGKAHLHAGTTVVVTYPPNHLLQHLQDKAKAWEDLCLAKLTIANL